MKKEIISFKEELKELEELKKAFDEMKKRAAFRIACLEDCSGRPIIELNNTEDKKAFDRAFKKVEDFVEYQNDIYIGWDKKDCSTQYKLKKIKESLDEEIFNGYGLLDYIYDKEGALFYIEEIFDDNFNSTNTEEYFNKIDWKKMNVEEREFLEENCTNFMEEVKKIESNSSISHSQ